MNNTNNKIIDLSHAINDGMPVYPGDEAVSLNQTTTIETDAYTSYLLKTGMHVGTHVDSPNHLVLNGEKINEISLDRFMGNACLFDVRGENIIQYKPEYASKLKENTIVLFYTGHDKLYGTEAYYSSHPVIHPDFADYLVERKIKLIGIDTPSPDYEPFLIHKKLLSNGICLLENLTNLHALLSFKHFDVFALPLKINAEASLVRAIAIVS